MIAWQRRRVLHFDVTEHPCSAWTGQQVVEAFRERPLRRLFADDFEH